MSLADEIIARYRPKKGFEMFDSAVKSGDEPDVERVHLPTGNFILDYASMGGLPLGSVSQFWGNEGVGKTESAGRCVAQAQFYFKDKAVVWADTENAFDREYMAETFGIDLSRLILIKGLQGEALAQILSEMSQDPAISLIVLDSVPQMMSEREMTRDLNDSNPQMGYIANIMRPLVGRLLINLAVHASNGRIGPGILLLNQTRDKTTPTGRSYQVWPGGKSIGFACHLNVLFKKDKEKPDSKKIGDREIDETEHQFDVTKTRLGNSERSGEFGVIRDMSRAPLLMPGTVDDSMAMVAFAKKHNLFVGSSRNGYSFAGVAESATYAKMEEAGAALDADAEMKRKLSYLIIAAKRADERKRTSGWHVGEVANG